MGAAASASSVVTTALHGDVLVVTIDNPPVNALGAAVRQGLLAAMQQAQADAAVAAVLLVGAGKAFIAGADIREFGKPPVPPALPEVCRAIEGSDKPVVAVLHGAALGGGLEVALSAHYRLALPAATVGLPEVNLGLLPGSGGTQRAPRLMGVQAATAMMLSGQHLKAQAALQAGLVDKLVEGADAQAAGLAYVRELLTAKAPVRRTRDLAIAEPQAALAWLEEQKAETAKKARGLFSPLKIIECVQAAVQLPFDEGLARERALFIECLDSPQRAGLIHAFFAEREVAKVPEAQAAQPRPVASIAVIGGGTMGAGIAVAALDAGLPVTMIERDAESIARGRANVEKVYNGLVAKGRMTEAAKAAVMARYIGSTHYADIAQVDLVIEAVFEDIEVKKAVFRELDRVCKPGAVLATNTSYLDIDAIAASTSRRFTMRGGPFEPSVDSMPDELELREQSLPNTVDWQIALQRASSLFGLTLGQTLNAANVGKLVDEVKQKVGERRDAVSRLVVQVRDRAGRYAAGTTGSRQQTAESAQSFLAAVASAADSELVTTLAGADLQTSEAAVGRALGQAKVCADVLELGSYWQLFDVVLKLNDHRAEAAQVIGRRLAEVLISDEHVLGLKGRLDELHRDAMTLLAAAAPVPAPVAAAMPSPGVPAPAPVAIPPVPANLAPEVVAEKQQLHLMGAEAVAALEELKARITSERDLELTLSWRLQRKGTQL